MFRTEIVLSPSPQKITLRSPILSMGSCFAQIIGGKLKHNKFDILANPFGVIYNPISVFDLIKRSILNKTPEDDTYLENQSVHYSFCFHSDVSALTKDELVKMASVKIKDVNLQIKKAKWMMITLGTAFVYKRNDTHDVVANCHKLPDSFFSRELLEPEDIVNGFDECYSLIKDLNPDVRFIFTVSPVRHVRDTLPQNSVSKAILRYACDKLIKKYVNVDYFPSFELLIDDLRDYRFYASDMLHPNETSENYVWDKFIERYMDEESQAFIKQWNKLSKAFEHRPFYPNSPNHQEFLKKTLEKLNQLKHKVNVNTEIEFIQKQIL